MEVDILLYFSASWELWPKALAASLDIIAKFDAGHYPWCRCFGRIYYDTASMPPEMDA
jgi:hypothetical protein